MLWKFSVKRPYTIIAAVALVLILGSVSLERISAQLLPEGEPSHLAVVTEYPGGSAQEVETEVTKPVEQVLAALDHVSRVTSVSNDEKSVVVASFEGTSHLDGVTADAREKLNALKIHWDEDVSDPIMTVFDKDDVPAFVIAVEEAKQNQEDLTETIQEQVLWQLESVKGVAGVTFSGGSQRQAQVVINEDKIRQVNERIQNQVEEQLDQAQQELLDAKEQLDQGTAELQEQMDALSQGMTEADQGVLDGKLELLKAEIQLSQSSSDLASKETEIGILESVVGSMNDMLESMRRQISEEDAQVAQREEQVAQTGRDIENREQELAEKRASLEEQIQELTVSSGENDPGQESGGAESDAEKEDPAETLRRLQEELADVAAQEQQLALEKAAYQIEKATVEGERAAVDASLEELGKYESQAASTTSRLNEAKAALEAAKSQVSAGQETVNTGQEAVNQQEQELSQQNDEAQQQLQNTKEESENSAKELEQQIQDFSQTREETLASVAIDGAVTRESVESLLRAQDFSEPLGRVTQEDIGYLVRMEQTIADPEELEQLVLMEPQMAGVDAVTLGDVADIQIADDPQGAYVRVNGSDGCILIVKAQNTYDIWEVSAAVNEQLKNIEEQNPQLQFTVLMDQGNETDALLHQSLVGLLGGAVLAVLILVLFLRRWKASLLLACCIPLSAVLALALMYVCGVTWNLISLSALTVTIGMLANPSVMVWENIQYQRSQGGSPLQAALRGTARAAGAVMSSVLAGICVFLPMVCLEGLTWQIFQDAAVTILCSGVASLLTALTFVPMAASRFQRQEQKKEKKDGMLSRGHAKLCSAALRRRWLVLAVSVLLLAGSAVAATSRGAILIPKMDGTHWYIAVNAVDGSANARQLQTMADEVMERIQSVEHVEAAAFAVDGGDGFLGQVQEAMGSVGIHVIMDQQSLDKGEALTDIRDACADLEECQVRIFNAAGDAVWEEDAGISIQIFGQEWDKLTEIAKDAAAMAEDIQGIESIVTSGKNLDRELRITVDQEAAADAGLTAALVYNELAEKLAQEENVLAIVPEQGAAFEIGVSETEKLQSPDDVRNYTFAVEQEDGTETEVMLSDIATVEEIQTISRIERENQRRVITIRADVASGYEADTVARDLQKKLDSYQTPDGYEIALTGETEMAKIAFGQMIAVLLLAVALIFLVLLAQFQSLADSLAVACLIPLAFTGGCLGLFVSGQQMSLSALVGFLLLEGLSVGGGIMLIKQIHQLQMEGVEKQEAVLLGTKMCRKPIFMMTAAVIAGLFPVALGLGEGFRMLQPMAIVMAGGLAYAAVVTLTVIPVLYDWFAGKKVRK